MRVYYKPANNPYPTGNEGVDSVTYKYLNNLLELHKYKVMWKLRSIESMIDSEDGVIHLDGEGDISLSGFSPEMEARILSLL